MNIVSMTLDEMNSVSKPQKNFMLALFAALFACVGRANMTNLSRYGAGSRRRIQRWNQRPFDFRASTSLLCVNRGFSTIKSLLLLTLPSFPRVANTPMASENSIMALPPKLKTVPTID